MNSVVLPGESENHCRFCFDVYQVPVFLACGHSVCAGCARNMLDYEILKVWHFGCFFFFYLHFAKHWARSERRS